MPKQFHDLISREEAKDRGGLGEALGVTSPTRARIDALMRLGFRVEDIAKAVGVSGQSVRLWIEGKQLSPANHDALDEFRAVVELLYRELGPDAVQPFFRSKPAPGAKRPLDYMHADPQSVGAAAFAEIRRREGRVRSDDDGSELGPVAQGIMERAHGDRPDPIPAPSEPSRPELVDDAHVDMALERRDWESGLPPHPAA